MAPFEPTEIMRAQMKVHLKYMQACQGWTPDECRELLHDYKREMETHEGFSAIEAHLASVVPLEEAALARHFGRAA